MITPPPLPARLPERSLTRVPPVDIPVIIHATTPFRYHASCEIISPRQAAPAGVAARMKYPALLAPSLHSPVPTILK